MKDLEFQELLGFHRLREFEIEKVTGKNTIAVEQHLVNIDEGVRVNQSRVRRESGIPLRGIVELPGRGPQQRRLPQPQLILEDDQKDVHWIGQQVPRVLL